MLFLCQKLHISPKKISFQIPRPHTGPQSGCGIERWLSDWSVVWTNPRLLSTADHVCCCCCWWWWWWCCCLVCVTVSWVESQLIDCSLTASSTCSHAAASATDAEMNTDAAYKPRRLVVTEAPFTPHSSHHTSHHLNSPNFIRFECTVIGHCSCCESTQFAVVATNQRMHSARMRWDGVRWSVSDDTHSASNVLHAISWLAAMTRSGGVATVTWPLLYSF